MVVRVRNKRPGWSVLLLLVAGFLVAAPAGAALAVASAKPTVEASDDRAFCCASDHSAVSSPWGWQTGIGSFHPLGC